MLDKKISTLLFTHDCVIVPGLGGFVASQVAAKHNAVQHIFIPPARVIAFNVFLRQNDGLLANFISSDEKISFSEALRIIERYVERCFMEMEAGRKVTVTDIGQLYFDSEKNIQFTPDETAIHALDSFGLTSLRVAPAVADKKKDILFAPLRASSKKEKPVPKRTRKKILPGSRLVNTGLVAGVLLWAMFNVYIIAPRNFNFSALNPFEKIESDRIRPVPAESPKPEEKNTPAAAPVIQPLNNAPEKIKEENTPPPLRTIAESSTGHYFTVVGVFSVSDNADNMLSKLRASGYQNCGSIEREHKPTIVYASRYDRKEDAFDSVQHLKEQGIDSWVLTR